MMTPERITAMQADAAQGTPGPWGFETVITSCGLCHKIGPWPHEWRGGKEMSACIYDDYSPIGGSKTMVSNAHRIARVPDMEATIIEQAAEIERLQAELYERGAEYAGDPK